MYTEIQGDEHETYREDMLSVEGVTWMTCYTQGPSRGCREGEMSWMPCFQCPGI